MTRQIMKQKPFHGESFYLTGTPFIILHLSFTANKKMKLNIILISDIFLFAVAEGKKHPEELCNRQAGTLSITGQFSSLRVGESLRIGMLSSPSTSG